MCGRSYRPRPDNGSGDSPRPPFLSEFVNHIGKLTLVEVVYHLFGGTLGMRVHPHIERAIRLKTESTCGIGKLQAAYANVGEQTVRPQSSVIGQTRKRPILQLDGWPIGVWLPASGFGILWPEAGRRKPDACYLQRHRL